MPSDSSVTRFTTEMVNEILNRVKNNHIDMVERILRDYQAETGKENQVNAR